MPCHGFLFSLPRCGTEYVRIAQHSRLIPCSTLSHCSIPRTPLRLPCSPAEVSLSPGFQDSLPALPHAGNAAHIFPSSVTIPRSTCVKVLPHTSLQANISPRSSPLIIFQCSECFVFLHTDIQFRQIKNAETFVVKVHSLPRGIYLHSILPIYPFVTGLPGTT